MTPEQVIRRPIILTEKATLLREKHNQVVFEVARDANKIQIREAVEKRFNVIVLDVNTATVRSRERGMGKRRGTIPGWKKAFVTLAPGQSIDDFFGSV